MNERDEELGYTFSFSKTAMSALQGLPAAAQQALSEVIAALVEEPDKFAGRIRGIQDKPKNFIYSHPDPPLEATYELDDERKNICFIHFAAPALKEQKPLFISYSHRDARWKTELLKWLKVLEDHKIIEPWDDQRIQAGEKWREEIDRTLGSAKAAVLLVSQDFLASDFIAKQELPVLLEAAESGRLKLFWIAVSTSTYEDTPLREDQALNDPARPLDDMKRAERNKVFLEIKRKIVQGLCTVQSEG